MTISNFAQALATFALKCELGELMWKTTHAGFVRRRAILSYPTFEEVNLRALHLVRETVNYFCSLT